MAEALNRHVMIIEDSADLQVLLARFFKKEGYRLSQAYNGQEALDILNTLPVGEAPSLILLDLMMPVMDGYQFRQAQLQDIRFADIPVVVMTADSDPAKRAQQLGVQHYFAKPIHNISSLMQVVDEITSEPQSK